MLIPQIQDSITFQGKPLVVVRLPNGDPGVVLRWICENLHIGTKAQVERIKRTEVIADDLVYVRIQTDGGPQVLATLLLRSVPYWLATIDTRRMPKDDERRKEILDYQRNAVDALYAWAQSVKEMASPVNVVLDQQIVKPAPPADGASLDEWQEFHRQMVIWIEWQRDIQLWRGTIDRRVENLETVTSRILNQIGPPRITNEHQTLVQYYVSQLSKATKKDPAIIYAALKTRFRVPRYDEIPESEWPNVVNWFKKQFPGHELPVTQSTWFEQQERE